MESDDLERKKKRRQKPSRMGSNGKLLPKGWLRWYDDKSKSWYFENTTKKYSTWDDPTRGGWVPRWIWSHGEEEEEEEEVMFATIDDAFAGWCTEKFADEDAFDGEVEWEEVVTLRVYDVKLFRGSGLLNSVLSPFVGGAFHTGIEVFGREWSYGASEDKECGIFCCTPTKCQPHEYRLSIPLGTTIKREVDIFHILGQLAPYWSGDTYDVLRKNCNHFTILFAGALGVDPPPQWVHTLADGVADIDDRARRIFGAPPAVAKGRRRRGTCTKAAVVSDDKGRWRTDYFQTYADAKKRYDKLGLTYASVLFVFIEYEDDENDNDDDDDDVDDVWARFPSKRLSLWRAVHTYGLHHAVTNIQRRFEREHIILPEEEKQPEGEEKSGRHRRRSAVIPRT